MRLEVRETWTPIAGAHAGYLQHGTRTRRGALTSLAMLFATSAQGQTGSGGSTNPATSNPSIPGLEFVEMTLVPSPKLDTVFPFDVPFTLVVKGASDETLSIEVRLLAVRSSRTATPPCSSKEKWDQNLSTNRTDKGDFYTVVHPLLADRYVRGCLFMQRVPSGTDRKVMEQRISEQLMSALPDITEMSREGYTIETAKEIQRRLLTAARQVPGVDSVAPNRGSALDEVTATNAPDEVARRLRLSRFLGGATDAVEDARENLINARRELARPTSALRPYSPAFRAIVATLGDTTPAGVRFARALAQLDSIVSDTAWTRRFANGEIVPDGDTLRFVATTSLANLRGPADLAVAVARTKRTLAWVAALDTNLSQRRSALIQASGRPAAEMTAATEGLQSFRNSVEGVSDATDNLQGALGRRQTSIEQLAGELAIIVSESITFFGSTITDFATRAKNRVAVDFGATTLLRARRVVPTIGLNFYFKAFNKSVPWVAGPSDLKSKIARRASVGFALTTGSAGVTAREDVLGSLSPVVSAGFRISEIVRLSAGVLPMRAKEKGTFTHGSRWTLESAFTLSIDNDLRELMKPFADLLAPKP